MPVNPALIAAGGNLLGQGVNALTTIGQNKATRKWSEKMYGIQRADALADFHMQNEYNDPSSQMARLRKAGLNPNLVYGHGAEGNASSSVRPATVENWSPEPVKTNPGSAIADYMNVKVQEAQYNNLLTQNTVMQHEALLKLAQTDATIAGTDESKFRLTTNKSLFETTIAQALENLNKTRADIAYSDASTKTMLADNERKAALHAPTLVKAVEDILTLRMNRAKTQNEIDEIRARIKNINADSKLKNLDANLKERGIQPGDPLWLRAIAQYLSGNVSKIDRDPNLKNWMDNSPFGWMTK